MLKYIVIRISECIIVLLSNEADVLEQVNTILQNS